MFAVDGRYSKNAGLLHFHLVLARCEARLSGVEIERNVYDYWVRQLRPRARDEQRSQAGDSKHLRIHGIFLLGPDRSGRGPFFGWSWVRQLLLHLYFSASQTWWLGSDSMKGMCGSNHGSIETRGFSVLNAFSQARGII